MSTDTISILTKLFIDMLKLEVAENYVPRTVYATIESKLKAAQEKIRALLRTLDVMDSLRSGEFVEVLQPPQVSKTDFSCQVSLSVATEDVSAQTLDESVRKRKKRSGFEQIICS